VRTKIRRKKTARGIRWYVSTIAEDGGEEAHGGYGTRKEATAAAAALVTDARRGKYVSPAPRLTALTCSTSGYRAVRRPTSRRRRATPTAP
jgi:hypothetical protein